MAEKRLVAGEINRLPGRGALVLESAAASLLASDISHLEERLAVAFALAPSELCPNFLALMDLPASELTSAMSPEQFRTVTTTADDQGAQGLLPKIPPMHGEVDVAFLARMGREECTALAQPAGLGS